MFRSLLLLTLLFVSIPARADKPIDLGDRLEPLIDDFLIDQLEGGASLAMHQPEPREVVLTADKPWEGNTSVYFTIFQDGDLFRMYYRGSHYDEKRKKMGPEFVCYAESRDGIHFTKPELGVCEFEGSKKNNIVWNGVGTHCFTPFLDTNPDCPAEQRYKAISRGRPKAAAGLFVFASADGIHWKQLVDKPAITIGAFDSQNLVIWDSNIKKYVSYHRGFRKGVRDILRAESDDFIHWTEPQWLEYPGAPREHLYTNAVRLYPDAPHIRIGFPTRYQPKNSQVEPILMTSRDGKAFKRWNEPLIPINAPKDRDGNRSNYMSNGLLQLPDNEKEWSVYASEAYYTGPDMRLRRFTFRKDGLVSLSAGVKQGEMISKPLAFSGKELVVNFKTAPQGKLALELQSPDGKPIEGFSLADCDPLAGDSIAQTVSWSGKTDLTKLSNQPLRLRIQLENSALHSLRFK